MFSGEGPQIHHQKKNLRLGKMFLIEKIKIDKTMIGFFFFQLVGKDIEESIKEETSGHLRAAYLTLGKKL